MTKVKTIFLFGILLAIVSAPVDLFAASISAVGTFYDSSIESRSMRVEGDYAFLVTPKNSIRLINISNTAYPSEEWAVSKYPSRAKDIFFNGHYAYIHQSNGITISNVSDPLAPKRITSFYGQDIGGMVYGYGKFFTSDKYGYAMYDYSNSAGVASRLHIFDIDPLSSAYAGMPQKRRIGRYEFPKKIIDFKVSGKYAYFIDKDSGFYILDISIPSSPALVGENHEISKPRKIILNGDYAYISSLSPLLYIFNVSDPSNPALKGDYKLSSSGYIIDFMSSDNYLYAAVNGNDGLTQGRISNFYILDLSNPDAPIEIASHKSAAISNFSVKDKYAFIVYKKNGLRIFKIDFNAQNSKNNESESSDSNNFSDSEDIISGEDLRNVPDKTAPALSSASCSYLPEDASSPALISRFKGSIMLQVENNGEAWYVHPGEKKRYCLGRPADAFSVMRSKGYGITNANLAKIPSNMDSFEGDLNLRQKMSGKILLQVESKGEAWYVNPKNLKRYYLGRPADAFKVMQNLGSGITNANLAKIPSAANGLSSTNGIAYARKTVKTKRGDFSVDLITANLSHKKVKILTDTSESRYCKDNCKVKQLKEYVVANSAAAGINGTYFCPKDYPQCAKQDGSHYWMLYNSRTKTLFNEAHNIFNNGPLIVFNDQNNWIFYRQAKEFQGVQKFEFLYNTKVQAAISSDHLLVYKSKKVLDESALDAKQRTVKSARGALGIKGTKVFMLNIRGATVSDLAEVTKSMGMEYAINLDGGGSSALYYKGQYKIGPGRNIPNAIVVAER